MQLNNGPEERNMFFKTLKISMKKKAKVVHKNTKQISSTHMGHFITMSFNRQTNLGRQSSCN
jgi:hypothetical protein